MDAILREKVGGESKRCDLEIFAQSVITVHPVARD